MRNNGGFTLIELILVTVIIGILAGMVVVNYGGRVRDTQIRAAKGDIASYGNAIDLYALDNNDEYPKSLSDLVGGKRNYVREIRKDPWGTPYRFKLIPHTEENKETEKFAASVTFPNRQRVPR